MLHGPHQMFIPIFSNYIMWANLILRECSFTTVVIIVLINCNIHKNEHGVNKFDTFGRASPTINRQIFSPQSFKKILLEQIYMLLLIRKRNVMHELLCQYLCIQRMERITHTHIYIYIQHCILIYHIHTNNKGK